jgi:hypothetical protein
LGGRWRCGRAILLRGKQGRYQLPSGEMKPLRSRLTQNAAVIEAAPPRPEPQQEAAPGPKGLTARISHRKRLTEGAARR